MGKIFIIFIVVKKYPDSAGRFLAQKRLFIDSANVDLSSAKCFYFKPKNIFFIKPPFVAFFIITHYSKIFLELGVELK